MTTLLDVWSHNIEKQAILIANIKWTFIAEFSFLYALNINNVVLWNQIISKV